MGINTRNAGKLTAQTSAQLTDSSGGTASSTIAAIGATYDQAEVRNAVASLAAQVNALQTEVTNAFAKLDAGEGGSI